jgi:hypothetical protein
MGTYNFDYNYELPDPDDLPSNNWIEYKSKVNHGYSMDTEKDDKTNQVSDEELEHIEKILKQIDLKYLPPDESV